MNTNIDYTSELKDIVEEVKKLRQATTVIGMILSKKVFECYENHHWTFDFLDAIDKDLMNELDARCYPKTHKEE